MHAIHANARGMRSGHRESGDGSRQHSAFSLVSSLPHDECGNPQSPVTIRVRFRWVRFEERGPYRATMEVAGDAEVRAQVWLVVDGSAGVGRARLDWSKLVESFPEDTRLHAVFAHFTPEWMVQEERDFRLDRVARIRVRAAFRARASCSAARLRHEERRGHCDSRPQPEDRATESVAADRAKKRVCDPDSPGGSRANMLARALVTPARWRQLAMVRCAGASELIAPRGLIRRGAALHYGGRDDPQERCAWHSRRTWFEWRRCDQVSDCCVRAQRRRKR